MKSLARYVVLIITAVVITASCSNGKEIPSDGNVAVNRWTERLMTKFYLWNHELDDFRGDYSKSYDSFLADMLRHVDKKGHANSLDGYVRNSVRYYYSYIKTDRPQTRGELDKSNDTGIRLMGFSDQMGGSLAILSVTPGTSAARNELHRGDLILKVNGEKINRKNYSTLANKASFSTCSLEVRGKVGDNIKTREVYLVKEKYMDPGIYRAEVSGKTAYLLYNSFNVCNDEKLIETFNDFKQKGASELILDLRHNGGGHLISSQLLATLISGEKVRGKVYAKMSYNDDRRELDHDIKFGDQHDDSHNDKYKYLADKAFDASLNLDHVYIITSFYTASASEMVINGLRGAGIEVHLIGTTTNGKNVGMEVFSKKIKFDEKEYNFQFAPITFKISNGRDESDYSDGFEPDCKVEGYKIADFFTSGDQPYAKALEWIKNGVKPSSTRGRVSPQVLFPKSSPVPIIMPDHRE